MDSSSNRRFTGIDSLVAAAGTDAPRTFYAADGTTFAKWSHSRSLRLWRLVALHSGLDPDSLGVDQAHAVQTLTGLQQFREMFLSDEVLAKSASDWLDNLQRAQIAVDHGELLKDDPTHFEPWTAKVEVARFQVWCTQADLPVVGGWPLRSAGLNAESVDGGLKWPWGRHETASLRLLAGAAKLWRTTSEGGNYDPAEPSTAPTNEQVEVWLEQHGLTSQKLRESIATILRPSNFPKGPRPSR